MLYLRCDSLIRLKHSPWEQDVNLHASKFLMQPSSDFSCSLAWCGSLNVLTMDERENEDP